MTDNPKGSEPETDGGGRSGASDSEDERGRPGAATLRPSRNGNPHIGIIAPTPRLPPPRESEGLALSTDRRAAAEEESSGQVRPSLSLRPSDAVSRSRAGTVFRHMPEEEVQHATGVSAPPPTREPSRFGDVAEENELFEAEEAEEAISRSHTPMSAGSDSDARSLAALEPCRTRSLSPGSRSPISSPRNLPSIDDVLSQLAPRVGGPELPQDPVDDERMRVRRDQLRELYSRSGEIKEAFGHAKREYNTAQEGRPPHKSLGKTEYLMKIAGYHETKGEAQEKFLVLSFKHEHYKSALERIQRLSTAIKDGQGETDLESLQLQAQLDEDLDMALDEQKLESAVDKYLLLAMRRSMWELQRDNDEWSYKHDKEMQKVKKEAEEEQRKIYKRLKEAEEKESAAEVMLATRLEERRLLENILKAQKTAAFTQKKVLRLEAIVKGMRTRAKEAKEKKEHPPALDDELLQRLVDESLKLEEEKVQTLKNQCQKLEDKVQTLQKQLLEAHGGGGGGAGTGTGTSTSTSASTNTSNPFAHSRAPSKNRLLVNENEALQADISTLKKENDELKSDLGTTRKGFRLAIDLHNATIGDENKTLKSVLSARGMPLPERRHYRTYNEELLEIEKTVEIEASRFRAILKKKADICDGVPGPPIGGGDGKTTTHEVLVLTDEEVRLLEQYDEFYREKIALGTKYASRFWEVDPRWDPLDEVKGLIRKWGRKLDKNLPKTCLAGLRLLYAQMAFDYLGPDAAETRGALETLDRDREGGPTEVLNSCPAWRARLERFNAKRRAWGDGAGEGEGEGGASSSALPSTSLPPPPEAEAAAAVSSQGPTAAITKGKQQCPRSSCGCIVKTHRCAEHEVALEKWVGEWAIDENENEKDEDLQDPAGGGTGTGTGTGIKGTTTTTFKDYGRKRTGGPPSWCTCETHPIKVLCARHVETLRGRGVQVRRLPGSHSTAFLSLGGNSGG